MLNMPESVHLAKVMLNSTVMEPPKRSTSEEEMAAWPKCCRQFKTKGALSLRIFGSCVQASGGSPEVSCERSATVMARKLPACVYLALGFFPKQHRPAIPWNSLANSVTQEIKNDTLT